MERAKIAALWFILWLPWALGSLLGALGYPLLFGGVRLVDWAEAAQRRVKARMGVL